MGPIYSLFLFSNAPTRPTFPFCFSSSRYLSHILFIPSVYTLERVEWHHGKDNLHRQAHLEMCLMAFPLFLPLVKETSDR